MKALWVYTGVWGGLALFLAALVAALGDSPWILVQAAYNTLATGFGLGYTFFYMTPLLCTGLSVAVCLRTGLFNIGAEGQLYMGSLAAVGVALAFPSLPWPLALPLAVWASAAAGAAWGGLAGFLKAKRGSHEVITTILLNFIAIALVDYCVLYPLKNPEVQNPETLPVATGFWLPNIDALVSPLGVHWFANTPVNVALVLALSLCVFIHWFLKRTVLGFELRVVGTSPDAARYQGIAVSSRTVFAMALGGACAGLVGVNEIFGHEHRLLQGFSPQYGFVGIAVALLARNRPLVVILTSFLFGALHTAAREVEFLGEHTSREVMLVIEALLIGAAVGVHWLGTRGKR